MTMGCLTKHESEPHISILEANDHLFNGVILRHDWPGERESSHRTERQILWGYSKGGSQAYDVGQR